MMMKFEKFIAFLKMFCPPIFWTLAKKLPINPRKYYGLGNLDKTLEKFLPYEGGFFVELGANDGLKQSNTFYFERFKKWRGILIEPSPHNFHKLIINRSPENFLSCNACVSFNYKEPFVPIVYSDLMSSPLNLESDLPDEIAHAFSGKQFLEKTELIYTFGAIAKTLNEILIQAQAPNVIDLLSLDVEGAEIEVLKGIDHASYRFKYICIEIRDFEKISTYLQSLDYKYIQRLSPQDFLFSDCRIIE